MDISAGIKMDIAGCQILYESDNSYSRLIDYYYPYNIDVIMRTWKANWLLFPTYIIFFVIGAFFSIISIPQNNFLLFVFSLAICFLQIISVILTPFRIVLDDSQMKLFYFLLSKQINYTDLNNLQIRLRRGYWVELKEETGRKYKFPIRSLTNHESDKELLSIIIRKSNLSLVEGTNPNHCTFQKTIISYG